MGTPAADDPFQKRLAAPPPAPAPVHHEARGRRFHRPTTLEGLFAVLAGEPEAKLVSGGTDVVVEVNQRDARFDCLVALDAVEELHTFDLGADAIVIGAGVTLGEIEQRIHGQVPMLEQLLPLFSSRLIRNRATLGGNVINASPIGDGPPALLALDAELVLASAKGERVVPIDGFFTGYRATKLAPGEIVRAVRIPRPLANVQRFYKVSKRILDDISTVAAAFALDVGDDGTIRRARLAFGGVAATPVRAHAAEEALEGHRWNAESARLAKAQLEGAFTPIDDHRGSAAYRSAMVTRLIDKLLFDTGGAGGGARLPVTP